MDREIQSRGGVFPTSETLTQQKNKKQGVSLVGESRLVGLVVGVCLGSWKEDLQRGSE
jgi:hypothetical protein